MKIDESLSSGNFKNLPEFQSTFSHIQKTNGSLHLFTLFGSGGVHSSQIHLEKILKTIPSDTPIFLHLFTDGRDLAPTSALGILIDFRTRILSQYPNTKIASLAGRYFAMDRDNNYDRIE